MSLNFEIRNNTNPRDAKFYDTASLREEYLIEDLIIEGETKIVYTDYDRMIIGGIVPTDGKIKLEPIEFQKTEYFNQSRETGIINVGGKGKVVADGETFDLDFKDALYLGLGVKDVYFTSDDLSKPAKFYLNSALAYIKYPNVKVSKADRKVVSLGTQKNINQRDLCQYIVPGKVQTNQLMMGITEVKEGNSWNTMPCHVHELRMEAYYYFEIDENEAVAHFMGQPDETRHLWVHNDECVISPAWSIHTAAGTNNYSFIWGMAGSDSDVDAVLTRDLR